MIDWPTIFFSVIFLLVGVSILVPIIPNNYMLFNWIALPCWAILIMALGNKDIPSMQKSHSISYMSSISYTFFLAQMLALWPICKTIIKFVGIDGNIIRICLSLLMCTIISVLLHELIEVKAMKYLNNKYLKQ